LIYPPLKSNATIRPSKEILLSISSAIGFLLPLIFGVIKELTNRKLITKKNLQNNTKLPVLAELEQVTKLKNFPFVVGGNSRSMFGEQIRSLRTNMNFYLNPDKDTNYILVTSSISGEGKSFLSTNIAKSYSLQGKKVALLEFDLRRPKITSSIGLIEIDKGLSSFLIGKASVDEIIHTIVKDEDEHLDLFPAGSIPPNPQELISSKYMKVLKEYLDKNYEIVVIDSPPFGVVADAQVLAFYADITLIVSRFNLTTIDQIKEINNWNERKIFKSMGIVFNGVKNSGYFGYQYGNYYYRRKYGYGYYNGYSSDRTNKRKAT
jgi:Mrp family chromosome partitioning ATPase